MVKRKTVRQKIGRKEARKSVEKDAVVSTSQSEEGELGSSFHNSSSRHLKRKVTRKMQFLSRLQETQSVLRAKKAISKKKHGRKKKSALNSLSSLAEVLPFFKEKSSLKQLQLHQRNQGRARQQLVVSETKQLSKVLKHPQFKSNPFSAIHEHLVNTLGLVLEERGTPSHKGEKKRRSKKKKKNNNDMEE